MNEWMHIICTLGGEYNVQCIVIMYEFDIWKCDVMWCDV